MGKKSGFTLIEILAVIIILSIVLSIAFPIIINIVGDAKKSAFKETAHGIISAGRYYYSQRLLNLDKISSDIIFTFPDNYNGLKISGRVPSKGKMIITPEGKISISISDGKYCVTKDYNDNDVTMSENLENCIDPSNRLELLATKSKTFGINKVASCATIGTCDVGTPFAIKVNNNEIYKFYVIKDDGNTVTLVMDRNIGDRIPWDEAGFKGAYFGPVTALEELHDETSNWMNIDPFNYILENDSDGDSGSYTYSPLPIINARARLLTLNEMLDLNCTRYSSSATCPNFFFENLSVNNTATEPIGYWLSTAPSNNPGAVYFAARASDEIAFPQLAGFLSQDRNGNYISGVRPIITINKKAVPIESINAEDISVVKHSSREIVTFITPTNASNKVLKYTSSNDEIATVDSNGVVTGKNYGDVTITIETTDSTNIRKTVNVSVVATNLLEVATTSETLGINKVATCATIGTCDVGTPFAIEVNNNEIYKFYVIKDDGKTATLIMDRNIGDRIPWDEAGFKGAYFGPVTALEELHDETSNWMNIDPFDYTLENDPDGDGGSYTYSPLQIANARARLLTLNEMLDLNCTRYSSSANCPSFLFENLSVSNTVTEPIGYWLSTAPSNNPGAVYFAAIVSDENAFPQLVGFLSQDRNGNYISGVRPVIELYK